MADEAGFLERCEEIRKIAFSFSEPLIVHHYDADGLCAGAIVAGAFRDAGRPFRLECVKKLDDAAIERFAGAGELIFADVGGANARVDELRDVVIIDHHQTEGVGKPQANPMLFGIDGGEELSAAGTAYCVFRSRAELAVVGAMGDMQKPLRGMNRWVAGRGVESGVVRIEEDVSFYGRYCRPLVQFIAYSDDPYLPGLSYREDKAMELLAELGISLEETGRLRAYADLSDGEKKLLVSALVKSLIGSGRTNIVEEGYIFPKRPRNETYEANEFSTLLNACGRHGKADIGIRLCLEDESAYGEAAALLRMHRRMLRDGMAFASSRIADLGPFRFLDGRGVIDENVIGIVCGMGLQQSRKPLLGVSLGENGTLKVSGRAPRTMPGNGVNLGALMKDAAAVLGGAGGGHRMAAGAAVPAGALNEFLLIAGKRINEAIG